MLVKFRLVLAVLSVLLCDASVHAQTPFYQGKTIRLVAGTPAGSVYDLYARHGRAIHAQTYSRQSQYHRTKHAGCGLHGCGKLHLQRGQA